MCVSFPRQKGRREEFYNDKRARLYRLSTLEIVLRITYHRKKLRAYLVKDARETAWG
jgi:hypothetical protein